LQVRIVDLPSSHPPPINASSYQRILLIIASFITGNYSQPVNIGNPEEYTVKEFAELIKGLTKSNSTIRSLPPTKDDPKQRRPDISTALEQLGWKPIVS